ncbi:MAG TPA: class I SAM-dependent methyltransferase family protein [Desulfurococcales archaeon]|nr:class I SAM-dependent methyltransferase family protein [Desulfurococcales archaeon]
MGKLRSLLKGIIPENILSKIPSSYDIIGDTIVIELPTSIRDYWRSIGEILCKLHKHVKTVYVKVSGVKGDYRIREVTPVYGVVKHYTIHKEYGVKMVVNVPNVYFNPSLGYEHHRVANLVDEGETVYDMFSGVGGFSLHIACRRNVTVYASDINPHAILCLTLSTLINKLKGCIIPILGDAKIIASYLVRSVDRVIMNLPEKSHEYLGYALKCLREDGGIIHYYHFDYSISSFLKHFIASISTYGGRLVKIVHTRKVLEVAPYKYLYVVDAYVIPNF